MTNLGPTAFGAATGKRVLIMNIADCEITDGRISREWLLRDNLALTRQLGFDSRQAALSIADRFNSELRNWLRQEYSRVTDQAKNTACTIGESETDASESLARQILENCWITGNREILDSLYAPYCVMHRAPVRTFSGRDAIQEHFSKWRKALPGAALSLDHICSQPFNSNGRHIAARWSVAGIHEGPIGGEKASGKPLYIVGVSHWRVLDGRIIAEWTVFDELALLAQALDHNT
jgi:predicted ester cyclase